MHVRTLGWAGREIAASGVQPARQRSQGAATRDRDRCLSLLTIATCNLGVRKCLQSLLDCPHEAEAGARGPSGQPAWTEHQGGVATSPAQPGCAALLGGRRGREPSTREGGRFCSPGIRPWNGESESVKVLVTQSCLTLCGPMDCSSPGSVHGILQARILEWVAISFSRISSQPRDGTSISFFCCFK